VTTTTRDTAVRKTESAEVVVRGVSTTDHQRLVAATRDYEKEAPL